MKIALINPSVPASLKKENLGLAYLAATLNADGHSTRIMDEIAGQDVESALDEFEPDIVGISFMTMYALRAYELATRIKQKRGLPVVFGGTHPSSLPEEAIQYGDCVIRGEAEWAFPKALQENRLEGIIDSPAPPDLDSLPMPSREQLDLDQYAGVGDEIAGVRMRTLGMITSRGCPFRCEYCINSTRETKLRFHSPERVIEELRFLVDRYNVQGIAFYDELMATHIDRFMDICEKIIQADLHHLKWECQIHARRIRPDMAELMKRAGCVQVNIGFESGSQRMLDRMQKDATVEHGYQAAETLHKAGLRVRGSFIVGTPGETPEDVEKTRKFIKKAKIDFSSIHYLTPYPGTAMWNQFGDEILKSGAHWDKFTAGDPDTFNCNNAMPPEEQKRLYEKLVAQAAWTNYSFRDMLHHSLNNPRHAIRVAANLLM